MIYSFDTDSVDEATAALLVYVLWRSRGSVAITPKIWGQVEVWTKAAAKRAENLSRFLEHLKTRLRVDTLSPKWMRAGVYGLQSDDRITGRMFLTDVISSCNQEQVISLLYRETVLIILLVRDRLERERPLSTRIKALDQEESDESTLDWNL